MLSLGVLEWVGAIGGGAGALLLAFNNRWSGYGFVLFLASNAAWMTYGVMTHTFGMVTMQIVCTGTSLLGIWRWLVKPRLGRSRRYREDLTMLPVQRLISSTRSMQPCANSSVFANVRNRLNPQLAAQQER